MDNTWKYKLTQQRGRPGTPGASGTASLIIHESAPDPHPQYQKEAEKGIANGYASLDASAYVPDAQINPNITRDAEADARYVFKAGDTMTGALTIATGATSVNLFTGVPSAGDFVGTVFRSAASRAASSAFYHFYGDAAGGAGVFIRGDGAIGLPPASRLYLDGGSDTYIYEVSANVVSVVAGGAVSMNFAATYAFAKQDFIVDPAKKIYLDGGTDTYIYESGANLMDFVVGGVLMGRFTTTKFGTNGDFEMPSLKKFYLDGGSDTYIYEAAANNVHIVAGGSYSMFFLNTSAGIPATNKFFLDGGSDTYISEIAANVIEFRAAGVQAVLLSSTSLNPRFDLALEPAKKLYLDGGGDTYIYESAANTISFVAAGSDRLRAINGAVGVVNGFFYVESGSKIYLDSGSDTYIYESSANNIDFVTGGSWRLVLNSAGMIIPPAQKFYIDGGTNTYIVEESDDVVGVFVGGTRRAQFNSFGVYGTQFYREQGNQNGVGSGSTFSITGVPDGQSFIVMVSVTATGAFFACAAGHRVGTTVSMTGFVSASIALSDPGTGNITVTNNTGASRDFRWSIIVLTPED